VALAFSIATQAAISSGAESTLADLEAHVAGLPPVRATRLLRAGRARLAAERAHRLRDPLESSDAEREAIGLLRAAGARPLLAQALLERARRHADNEALAEAAAIHTELGVPTPSA